MPASLALRLSASGNSRNTDTLPYLYARDSVADAKHLAHGLVPGVALRRTVAPEPMQLGAAEHRHPSLNHDLPRSGHRFRHIYDADYGMPL